VQWEACHFPPLQEAFLARTSHLLFPLQGGTPRTYSHPPTPPAHPWTEAQMACMRVASLLSKVRTFTVQISHSMALVHAREMQEKLVFLSTHHNKMAHMEIELPQSWLAYLKPSLEIQIQSLEMDSPEMSDV